MNLIKCGANDYQRITDFYKYVIDNTGEIDKYARWKYGLHPTDEMIKGYIDGGYMYYEEKDGEIIAAVALTPFQNEDYHPIDWSIKLKDDEVFVVHILCVNPSMQRHAVAKDIMDEIVQLAMTAGMKAIRLDALCCNQPAHKLYEKCGFIKRGIQNWYADNTGWIDFFLYELVL